MDDELTKTAKIIMARHFALRVVVTAILREHPSPTAVLEGVQDVAERIRAQLLASQFSDVDIADFELELESLCENLQR